MSANFTKEIKNKEVNLNHRKMWFFKQRAAMVIKFLVWLTVMKKIKPSTQTKKREKAKTRINAVKLWTHRVRMQKKRLTKKWLIFNLRRKVNSEWHVVMLKRTLLRQIFLNFLRISWKARLVQRKSRKGPKSNSNSLYNNRNYSKMLLLYQIL